MERGWRITMPNLEQTGLLRIDYLDLPDIASTGSVAMILGPDRVLIWDLPSW
jgi:hypothetical protein